MYRAATELWRVVTSARVPIWMETTTAICGVIATKIASITNRARQVGDQLDRGADEMAILLLLERLEVEARAAGGRVISMNGNHETMSVAGDFRYVDPGAYTDFARWKNWFELGERWKRGCKLPYETLPKVKVPPQAAARWVALQPGGPVTRRFLSRQPTLLRVGSSLFAHGGALPKHVDKEGQAGGMDGVNKAVQQWMLGDGSKQPGETRGRNSVVWSRHFGHEEAATDCELLRQTLRAAGAERLVVGHTIQPDLEVTHACNGRVYRIDVGMSAGCYDGEPAVLEVLNDQEVRVHTESNATWAGWVTNTFWTPKTKSKSR
eukprot:m.70761 g.70761  ORF g.70761 m.70761 type:complete len:321 (-) comp10030_c0_seq2:206-1168(-)